LWQSANDARVCIRLPGPQEGDHEKRVRPTKIGGVELWSDCCDQDRADIVTDNAEGIRNRKQAKKQAENKQNVKCGKCVVLSIRGPEYLTEIRG